MANPHHSPVEEEDPDILALREMALMTRKKKNSQSEASHPAFPEQNQSPVLHDHFHAQSHPQPMNGIGNFNGHHPNFPNQVHEMYPNHQTMYNPMYQPMHPHQPFPPRRPPFVGRPMMPVVPPHVNPHFVPQHTPMFGPTGQEIMPHVHGHLPEEGMPVMPDNGVFVPTPPSRLSPRSAQFVAMNNEALRRHVRRSPSPKRASNSPKYRYNSRSRSRSPHYKTQVSHIARKRTRSPDKAYTNKFNRRSPVRRQEKRPSPKAFENRRNNRQLNRNNENGNRDRFAKQNSDLKSVERTTPRTSPKPRDQENSDETPMETKETIEKSPSPAKPQADKNREKTEQELEDELLASSDSEQSEKDAGDDDEVKMTIDKEDLDFLFDEDDEESENEGRFKSKSTTSSAPPKKPVVNNFKSNYSRNYDNKSKAHGSGDRNYGRNDYAKRSRYDEPRRDRKTTRSPIESSQRKDEKRHESPIRKHKKSPEIRKSPEVSRKASSKESIHPAKVVVTKKEKVKSEEPPFKQSFKSVESSVVVEEKKKDEGVKKEERVRLVRGSVISRVEPLKTEKAPKPKEDARRPAIMKRLGGYIKDPAKVSKTWAKEQAP